MYIYIYICFSISVFIYRLSRRHPQKDRVVLHFALLFRGNFANLVLFSEE